MTGQVRVVWQDPERDSGKKNDLAQPYSRFGHSAIYVCEEKRRRRSLCKAAGGFVIHAQIEKCSQVIHDDRRTGSRAVFLCQPIRKSAALFASFIVILLGVVLRVLYCTVPAW